jgi:hypothetical protein
VTSKNLVFLVDLTHVMFPYTHEIVRGLSAGAWALLKYLKELSGDRVFGYARGTPELMAHIVSMQTGENSLGLMAPLSTVGSPLSSTISVESIEDAITSQLAHIVQSVVLGVDPQVVHITTNFDNIKTFVEVVNQVTHRSVLWDLDCGDDNNRRISAAELRQVSAWRIPSSAAAESLRSTIRDMIFLFTVTARRRSWFRTLVGLKSIVILGSSLSCDPTLAADILSHGDPPAPDLADRMDIDKVLGDLPLVPMAACLRIRDFPVLIRWVNASH